LALLIVGFLNHHFQANVMGFHFFQIFHLSGLGDFPEQE
jgi:hypothetical protein